MRTSSNNPRVQWTTFLASSIDPAHELDAVTSSLQILRLDDQSASTGSLEDLVDLHGALLLFQLGGQAELLPSTGFAQFRFFMVCIKARLRSVIGRSECAHVSEIVVIVLRRAANSC